MLSKIKTFISKNRNKILIALGLIVGSSILYSYAVDESNIKFSAFLKALKEDHIDEIIFEGNNIIFRSEASEWYHSTLGPFPLDQVLNIVKLKNVPFSIRHVVLTEELKGSIFGLICTAVSAKVMIDDIQGMNKTQILSKPQIYQTNCTFNDFYGGELIKTKFREVISFLRDPTKFKQMGARIRRGVLFYGPPGTGKTMLARALANEAGCEFIKASASQFRQIYVGVGAKRIRELFIKARACDNGCIIFIDQIDALGSRKSHLLDSSETTNTITQFLTEMDGFSENDRIIVVAATNRIDLVDDAALRAGRFDIKIHIPLPGKEERLGILKKIIQKKLAHNQISNQALQEICERSQGWCGADFETLINEAIYKTIRARREVMGSQQLMVAFREMMGGR